MADQNDDTEAGNNIPRNPPPNDPVSPQNRPPNDPLPPQNPPRIKDLINENLTELRGLQRTYNNVPALAPMLSTLNTIVDNIETLTNQQNAALRWRDEMHQMFDDGLDYDEVAALNITKDDLASLFANPKMGIPVDPKKTKLSIKWCTNDAIRANFWDRWWMVFDIPPHGNLDIPFYFLKKLYAEFVLKLKVNYWSMKPNMGLGLGAPQNRPSSQRKKLGTFVPPPDISPPPRVQHPDIMAEASSQTIRAIHRLSSLMISQARSVLPPRVDDVGASSSLSSSSHVCVPHTCITCKNICLGPIGDLPEYHFVLDEDTPDARAEATDPDAREEGNVEAWTPSVSLMTEEELRQIDDATLSAISFGLETSTIPPAPGGQSAGGEPACIDKGKGVATGDEPVQIRHPRSSGIFIRTESPIETPSAHEVRRDSYVDLMMRPLTPEEEPTIPTITEVPALPRAYERTPDRRRRSTREEASDPPSAAKRLHFDHPPAP